MSDTVITAIVSGLPAIILAIVALVKALKSEKTATAADERSRQAAEIAVTERNKRLLAER